MTPKKQRKRKRKIEQVIQEELGLSLQELMNLPWKKIIKLPVVFRGKIDDKEYVFEMKSRDEFYITIPDVCSAEPVSKEDGQDILRAVLEQQERLYGMPCEIDYGEDHYDNK